MQQKVTVVIGSVPSNRVLHLTAPVCHGPGRELHVVLDNSSTHSTPDVRAWLEAHPNVHFHFTPTGASWINMIEAWFGILTRKSVRRTSFRSVRALVRHIQHYIDHWNDDPTPFVWTKKPADIIRKAVGRGR